MRDALPLVSVIIPVFNCLYIGDAINSVMEQTYPSLEIIVVDDGSTDMTPEILAEFENIKLLRTENRGVSAARNEGMKICNGDFISFIDADDLWFREKTADQVAFLLDNHEYDVVYGRFRNFFQEGAEIPAWIDRAKFLGPSTGKLISLGTLMIRQKALLRAGMFDETFKIGEDLDWFIRFSEGKIKVFFNDSTVMMRRLHGNNISFRSDKSKRDLLKIFKASIDRKRDQKN